MTAKAIEIDERPGCYIDESAGSAEDLNRRICDLAEAYGWDASDVPAAPADDTEDADGDYQQILSECADEAVDWMNDHTTTPHVYWVIEDNSLFLMANVDGAREDVAFVSHTESAKDETCDADDASYPAPDYRGLWLHVSDHGNATLYDRGADGKDREIWGVV